MTTRQRAASQKSSSDDTGGDVVDINDGPVDLDLDQEDDSRAHIPPMTVRLGGKTFSIEPPDARTVLDIEQAPNTRAVLALVFDEDWPAASPLIDELDDPTKLTKLARQHARHFEIDEQAMRAMVDNPVSNRRSRRARRRASGRS